MALLFTKGVQKFVVKILDKYTYKVFSKNSFLKMKLLICGYQQVTTDAFTFPEELLKTNFSGCWLCWLK